MELLHVTKKKEEEEMWSYVYLKVLYAVLITKTRNNQKCQILDNEKLTRLWRMHTSLK